MISFLRITVRAPHPLLISGLVALLEFDILCIAAEATRKRLPIFIQEFESNRLHQLFHAGGAQWGSRQRSSNGAFS
jgi:hypothetical protein